ncbi:MAG: hypothetical protein KZQ96_20750 [Candidatus Thiodiazotropha sp. (ex Lucinoma borealis)]|nr:hypothetical protein [Candidatus Thiodiazotropha sp. (ex Lucinoma borealis)]
MDANRVDTSLVSLAASSLEDKVILKGRSFAVTLYRGLGRDVPWVVLVQLDKNYLDAIEPMTTLRLVDSGGMEWMRGSVDSNGEFTGVWLPSNGDLIKRAQDYSLSLVPE